MNGPLNIDLHTHSDRSDGALTPVELVRRAAAAGVEVLALTDHDTIEGIEDAGRCAAACGVRLAVRANSSLVTSRLAQPSVSWVASGCDR